MADVQTKTKTDDKGKQPVPDLKVDPELKGYLPDLDKETKSTLESSLKTAGRAIHPIEVWKKGSDRIIVDGHNRYEICKRLGLPFEVMELDFPNKEAVKRHMLEVQLRRRNMTKEQMSTFRANYLRMIKAKGVASGSGQTSAQHAAKDMGVSEGTIKRDAQFADGITFLKKENPDLAKEIEAGTSKVNKSTVQKIGAAKDEEARKKVIQQAVKESKREHRKVSDKPKESTAKTTTKAKEQTPTPATTASSRDTGKVIEKLSLFLGATTFAGRKKLMADTVAALNEAEGTDFAVPPEYTSEPQKEKPKEQPKQAAASVKKEQKTGPAKQPAAAALGTDD